MVGPSRVGAGVPLLMALISLQLVSCLEEGLQAERACRRDNRLLRELVRNTKVGFHQQRVGFQGEKEQLQRSLKQSNERILKLSAEVQKHTAGVVRPQAAVASANAFSRLIAPEGPQGTAKLGEGSARDEDDEGSGSDADDSTLVRDNATATAETLADTLRAATLAAGLPVHDTTGIPHDHEASYHHDTDYHTDYTGHNPMDHKELEVLNYENTRAQLNASQMPPPHDGRGLRCPSGFTEMRRSQPMTETAPSGSNITIQAVDCICGSAVPGICPCAPFDCRCKSKPANLLACQGPARACTVNAESDVVSGQGPSVGEAGTSSHSSGAASYGSSSLTQAPAVHASSYSSSYSSSSAAPVGESEVQNNVLFTSRFVANVSLPEEAVPGARSEAMNYMRTKYTAYMAERSRELKPWLSARCVPAATNGKARVPTQRSLPGHTSALNDREVSKIREVVFDKLGAVDEYMDMSSGPARFMSHEALNEMALQKRQAQDSSIARGGGFAFASYEELAHNPQHLVKSGKPDDKKCKSQKDCPNGYACGIRQDSSYDCKDHSDCPNAYNKAANPLGVKCINTKFFSACKTTQKFCNFISQYNHDDCKAAKKREFMANYVSKCCDFGSTEPEKGSYYFLMIPQFKTSDPYAAFCAVESPKLGATDHPVCAKMKVTKGTNPLVDGRTSIVEMATSTCPQLKDYEKRLMPTHRTFNRMHSKRVKDFEQKIKNNMTERIPFEVHNSVGELNCGECITQARAEYQAHHTVNQMRVGSWHWAHWIRKKKKCQGCIVKTSQTCYPGAPHCVSVREYWRLKCSYLNRARIDHVFRHALSQYRFQVAASPKKFGPQPRPAINKACETIGKQEKEKKDSGKHGADEGKQKSHNDPAAQIKEKIEKQKQTQEKVQKGHVAKRTERSEKRKAKAEKRKEQSEKRKQKREKDQKVSAAVREEHAEKRRKRTEKQRQKREKDQKYRATRRKELSEKRQEHAEKRKQKREKRQKMSPTAQDNERSKKLASAALLLAEKDKRLKKLAEEVETLRKEHAQKLLKCKEEP